MRVLNFEAVRLVIEDTEPLETNPFCSRCTLCERPRNVCIGAEIDERSFKELSENGEDPWDELRGIGRADCPPVLLVVGESPGNVEDQYGRPFVGPTGKYFRPLVEELWNGIVVYTNALRCMLRGKPTKKQVDSCRGYLAADIEDISPDLILCVGGIASQGILGKSLPVISTRGAYAQLSDGTPIVFALHPTAALRNRFVRRWFEKDLKWACDPNKEIPIPKRPVVHVVENDSDALEAVDKLSEDLARIDFDCETFGKFADDDFRVTTLSLSCGLAVYVWDERNLGMLRSSNAVQYALELLETAFGIGGQNVKFDLNVLWFGLGVDIVNRADCSRLLRKLLNVEADASLETMQYIVGLGGGKDEAGEYVDDGKKVYNSIIKLPKRKPKKPPRHSRVKILREDINSAVRRIRAGREAAAYAYVAIPEDVRELYCGFDAYSSGVLIDRFLPQVSRDSALIDLYNEVVLPMQRAVVMMERNGVLIDRDALDQAEAYFSGIVDEAAAKIKEYGDFNPASPKETAAFLYDELRLRCRKKTDSGGRSVDKETLSSLNHPAAEAILELRRASSWLSRYVKGFYDAIRDDGRVHANILIDGTATGRPSCSNPNMFNLPKPETFEGKLIRDVVVAPDGWVLVEVDQSQVEIRVAAVLSGDKSMIDLVVSGADFHLETARMVAPYLGLNPREIDKEHPLRSRAKTINFAVLYGDPPEGTAQRIGCSGDEAVKLQNALFKARPRLKAWIEEKLRFTRTHGWTRTHRNGKEARYRWLQAVADPTSKECATAERASWNTDVQGTAADITGWVLGKVQAYLDKNDPDQKYARLVLTVYDSVILEVREDMLPVVVREVVRISEMQNIGVPLVAEPKVGKAWGSLENYEPD